MVGLHVDRVPSDATSSVLAPAAIRCVSELARKSFGVAFNGK
jgi:hypothetical protein